MREFNLDSWQQFKESLDGYMSHAHTRRNQFYFRGHADSGWDLSATLDRDKEFPSEDLRNAFQDELLASFQVECGHLFDPRWGDKDGLVEAIARHAGLPTRLIDFSRSPYIASYFACNEILDTPPGDRPDRVAIMMIDRGHEDFGNYQGIEFLDDFITARAERGWAQRSILLRVLNNDRAIDQHLGNAVSKFTLPTSTAGRVIRELDEMNITHRTLFPGTDGAAATVIRRHYRDE